MTDNLLILLCLVDGEPTFNAFPVGIESSKTIGDLKELIKIKKTNDSQDVDADKLTLWSVSIPDDDNDNGNEIPIVLGIFNNKDKKKLRATRGVLETSRPRTLFMSSFNALFKAQALNMIVVCVDEFRTSKICCHCESVCDGKAAASSALAADFRETETTPPPRTCPGRFSCSSERHAGPTSSAHIMTWSPTSSHNHSTFPSATWSGPMVFLTVFGMAGRKTAVSSKGMKYALGETLFSS